MSQSRVHVGAYCEPELATDFVMAANVEERSLSDALRLAIRAYIERVAQAHKDTRPASRPADAKTPAAAGPAHGT